jgi:alginate O-acetyltransferase complex protein AlgI
MKLLLELFSFAIPMIILSWLLPRRYVLLSQIIVTGLFILYKSPLSFSILTITAFGNYFLLYYAKFSKTVKISVSLIFLILLFYTIKILFSINNNWIFPLGVSYYTVKNVHYTLEYYKGKIYDKSLLFYLAYNFFLPVFIIGPINRYPEFIKDWHRRRFDPAYFSAGIERVVFGFSKIVILSNYLFNFLALNFVNNLDKSHVWLKTYLTAIRYIFKGYFQFAGYSDIAIGLSLLLGFRVIENFDYPFFAANMAEFWRRYHISLSSFCRDYIYTPLTSYYRKPLFGIIATMLVIGLWHEMSVRYMLWALLQAAGIYASSFIRVKSKSIFVINAGRFFIINYYAITCIIVTNDHLGQAWDTYKILFLIK